MGKYAPPYIAKALTAFAGAFLTAFSAQLANGVGWKSAIGYSLLAGLGLGGLTFTVPNKTTPNSPPPT